MDGMCSQIHESNRHATGISIRKYDGNLKVSQDMNATEIDFMLEAMRNAMSTMDMAEAQTLHGRGREIIKAENVTEVEKIPCEMRHKAATAGNTSRIYAFYAKLNHSEENQEILDDELHHVRPSLSAFFSARTGEFDKLRGILEKRGNALIPQYGSVYKTELMIALADLAERDEI